MVKRCYIQDYPVYSGSVLTGIIASKITSRPFRLITPAKRKGRTEHKCKAGNKFSFRNKKLKTGKIAATTIKNS